MKTILIFLLFCQANFLLSQTNFTILNQNQIAANISDYGSFFVANNGVLGYEIPIGSGNSPIYNASIWFGGIDQYGAVRTSQSTILGYSDFSSGPYSFSNFYSNQSYIDLYSPSLWTVSKSEIEYHILNYQQAGYIVPQSILKWPGNGYFALGTSQNLAPFVDINGNNIYEPSAGDYPHIIGDRSTYVIMHDYTGSPMPNNPIGMGIEVHLMFSQFNNPGFLDSTTFLNVKVFNRGTYMYSDFKMAMLVDSDIGLPHNDYVGCDSSRNLMFTYNSIGVDSQFVAIHNPPSLGVVSLTHAMKKFGYFTNADQYPYNDPSNSWEIWNLLNGKWCNGSQWFYGGSGYVGSSGVTSIPTSYMFSGNPSSGTGWTELSNNNQSGDRRMFMVLDTVSLYTNESTCFDMAVVYSRKGNYLENVQGVIDNADSVKLFFQNYQRMFDCNMTVAGTNDLDYKMIKIYPNPSNRKFTISNLQESTDWKLTIHDIHGREVFYDIILSENDFEVDLNEQKGIFFVSLNIHGTVTTTKIIIQ